MSRVSRRPTRHLGLPWWHDEGDHNHIYTSDVGSQLYQVHVPPQYDGATRLPVIMAIHGCGISGFGWNSMKSTSNSHRIPVWPT